MRGMEVLRNVGMVKPVFLQYRAILGKSQKRGWGERASGVE